MIQRFLPPHRGQAPKKKPRGLRRYFRKVLTKAESYSLDVSDHEWWDYSGRWPTMQEAHEMKRYVKRFFTIDTLQWTTYLEIDGRWATRQVDVCPDIVIVYNDLERTDQPFDHIDDLEEIGTTEFEEVWRRCLKVPHGTRNGPDV